LARQLLSSCPETQEEVTMSPHNEAASLNREIAALAYRKFLERGSEPGHDLEDWLEAERELRGRAALDDAALGLYERRTW
jgi:hypothetical protein